MNWQPLTVCFELLSPLHIGFLPNKKGTVIAPTRCYVPGKNIWGAVTSALTPRLFPSPTAGRFSRIGNALKENLYFSYFYLSDKEKLFLPCYKELGSSDSKKISKQDEHEKQGLLWGGISDQEFRNRFLDSIVSTKISNEQGSAEYGSLHEIEFIRHRIGKPGEQSQPVLLIGYVWVREGAKIIDEPVEMGNGSIIVKGIDLFDDIAIGGERNYGFGRLQRATVPDDCKSSMNRIREMQPEEEIAIDRNKPLIGHLPYCECKWFVGDIEILAGREYAQEDSAKEFINPGKHSINSGYYFVPGTRVDAGVARMDWWGRLKWE